MLNGHGIRFLLLSTIVQFQGCPHPHSSPFLAALWRIKTREGPPPKKLYTHTHTHTELSRSPGIPSPIKATSLYLPTLPLSSHSPSKPTRKENNDTTASTRTLTFKCLTRDLFFKVPIKRQVISFQGESQYPHSEIIQLNI